MMMWLVCWDPGVLNIPTDAITDATLEAVTQPHAIKY
jgi:hypothetical protein